MRTRVKFEEPTYIVNKAKKTIVCILSCNMQLDKSPMWMEIHSKIWNKFPEVGVFGEFTVKATAKCSKDDTFDTQTGKRVAESKAKARAFKKAFLVYQEIQDYFMKANDTAKELKEGCERAKRVEEDHYQELIKG